MGSIETVQRFGYQFTVISLKETVASEGCGEKVFGRGVGKHFLQKGSPTASDNLHVKS